LSAQDPYYVLPLLMMGSMVIQTKLNPVPPDPVQAKVMMIMPFAFGVMFFFFPAGLVLYWLVNNILSIAQQWQITRMIEVGTKPPRALTLARSRSRLREPIFGSASGAPDRDPAG
jgi:YidC/Oxa1 family membrane protein insertase